MESVARKLTICQVDETGGWLQLGFEAEDGEASEGFKVAFSLSPEGADRLATSLGDSANVPFAEAVN